jgi:mannose-6-phosphate isomerase-like protein (cupin superfamily)
VPTTHGAVPTAIDLAEKLKPWQLRVVGQFNGHGLMVAKLKRKFTWHTHDDIDDFFLVLKGSLTVRLRGGDVTLGPGQLYVVPRGVEHCPVAEEGAEVLLIERAGTPIPGMWRQPPFGGRSSEAARPPAGSVAHPGA